MKALRLLGHATPPLLLEEERAVQLKLTLLACTLW